VFDFKRVLRAAADIDDWEVWIKKYSFSVRRHFAIVRILESDDFYPSGGDFSPQYSSSYHLGTVSHVVIIRYCHGQWGTSEHENTWSELL
jgi:hypothetical protein